MSATSILAGGSPFIPWLLFTLMFARIAIGVGLVCTMLERRENANLPAVLSSVLLLGTSFVLLFLSGTNEWFFSPVSAVFQMASFSLILIACVAMTYSLFRCSVWTAIFCATFGYTLQNLVSATSELLASLALSTGQSGGRALYFAVIFAPILTIYPTAYQLVIKRIKKSGLSNVEERSIVLMLPVVSLSIIGFDLAIKTLEATGVAFGFIVTFRLVHGAACVFALWMAYELLYRKRLELERATAERLLVEHDRQLRQSEQAIEAINIKCHDLRHQIRALANGSASIDPSALESVAREVRMYDTIVKTGNTALDTILSEKSLLCESHKITLTCIADGPALSFMEPADLYALFGNALDNAIEAVEQLDDSAKRTISLVVRQTMGTVSIHVENYFAGKRSFEGGLPLTTKGDTANHGFGTRSMRQIVERYDGTVTMAAKDNRFILDALIPLP